VAEHVLQELLRTGGCRLTVAVVKQRSGARVSKGQPQQAMIQESDLLMSS